VSADRAPACAAGYTAADWRALAAHRGDPHREEPAGWAAALDHLDRCAGCRRAALAADPTLVFRRLRAAPPAAPHGTVDPEVAAVQQGVAALRAARRLGTATAGRRPSPGWARGVTRGAAAAGLAATALLAGSTGPGRLAPMAPMAPILPAAARSAAAPTLAAAVPAVTGDPAQMPMLEELNRPDARVYQIEDSNFSVVWIVDKKLDV
jgi:hypothetical protein